MRTTIIRAIALAALAGASLTACGNDDTDGSSAEPGFTDKSVDEIKAAAVEDMKAATSLRMTGKLTQNGQEISLDLAITTEGSCDGTMSAGQGTANLRGVDGASYIKADKEFWTSTAGAQADMIVQMIGDKWAKLPSGGDSFSSLCDLDEFMNNLDDDDQTEEALGGTKEIGGVEAIEITGKEKDGTTSAWVSTADPHYILELSKTGGTDAGSFTFTDYNEDFQIEAPADDEVVDLGGM